MKRLLLLVLLLALAGPVFAQQRWERNYGGADDDRGHSVQQTTDGGYIVAGGTFSFGNGFQVYLIKTNASGNPLWTGTYGGEAYDLGRSVQQTQDGGYIVAGETNSFGNSDQVYLVKTNASGDTLWTRTYGGGNWDDGYFVQQTQDGGYIITGFTNSFGAGLTDVYLIKTNASGDTLWTKTYGGTDEDRGDCVQQTSDGGYVIAGRTYSFGNALQVYLIKTNANGDTLWTKTYGGGNEDVGFSVQQTQDGGYVVAGVTDSYGNGLQVYLIKTNASGIPLWTRTYGGRTTDYDYGYSVQQTSDTGYIVAGYTTSFGNGEQVYLIKTNASGDTLWTRTYGGTSDDEGRSVQQTSDGGYVVAGFYDYYGSNPQAYLIKTDANGSSGVAEARDAEFGMRNAELRITPNPFSSFATLPGHEAEKFNLYDISGKRAGSYRGDRVGADLGPGVYFLRPKDASSPPVRIVKVR
jgi:hypothetical protein